MIRWHVDEQTDDGKAVSIRLQSGYNQLLFPGGNSGRIKDKFQSPEFTPDEIRCDRDQNLDCSIVCLDP